MRSRNQTIRSKLVALVTVPLLALLALWVFATTLTLGPALNLLSAQTLLDDVGNPGEVLIGELQKERRLSVQFLGSSPAQVKSVPGPLVTQRAATDRAIADFRGSAGSSDVRKAASPELRNRIRQIFADLDSVPANRAHIDQRDVDITGAQGRYDTIVDTGFAMFTATAAFGDDGIDRQIRALTTVGRGQEYLSRTDALLAAATAAGRVDEEVRAELVSNVATARFLLGEGVADLPADDRTAFQRLNTSESFARLRVMQETLVASLRSGEPAPISLASWQPAYDSSAQQLRAFEVNAADALADQARPIAIDVLLRLGLAAVLGLIALAVSVLVAIRIGRSLVGRLVGLRREALEMAGERLPTVVRRLQCGEKVDVDVETPPLEFGRDEIGQLGQAFNDVQRTAVQTAVEEAAVRRGLNEVFLNIARRSQTLLHRQLALLDRMERRETEPDELEDLYRVDHLATRMRRHAEDLVILAGAAPGRGWRNPVPLIDVARGAISEVEDYKRVDIETIESSAVVGRAVGDVIHLLAELLENAASFSPPTTRVDLTGQILPNGYAIEVIDRGLGMSADALAEANRRLTEPPNFDPTDSARLGLFVVGQLAHRHGIRVTLRASAFGGVTAVVLIPGDLITAAPPMALPAGPSPLGPPPADAAWDRPLVGSGRTDPDRQSLAELQWRGEEQLESIPMPGRPVTLNGTAVTIDGGPEPCSTPDRPPATATARRLSSYPGAGDRRSHAEPGPRGAERRRTGAAQADGAAADPAVTGGGTDLSGAARPEAGHLGDLTEDGLPKRVRQANLAPQLRRPPAAPDPAVPPGRLRSPEQVRTIMTALQRGTTLGRQAAAAGKDPDANPAQPEETATVSLPVVRADDTEQKDS